MKTRQPVVSPMHGFFYRLVLITLLGLPLLSIAYGDTNRNPLREYELDSSIATAFSPDGESIVIGGSNGVMLFRTQTGEMFTRLEGHTDTIRCAAFSPDGRTVVTGSADKTARIWDAGTGEEIRRFTLSGTVTSVHFSPDGSRLVTSGGGSGGYAIVWDLASGEKYLTVTDLSFIYILSTAFSFDGRLLATGHGNGHAKLWDLQTKKMLWDRSIKGSVQDIAFSPDGEWIAAGTDEKNAKILNAKTGTIPFRFEGYASSVSSVSFSADGSLLLTGSWDNTIQLRLFPEGEVIREYRGDGLIDCAVFSPDSRTILSGSFEGKAKLWDVSDLIWGVPSTGIDQYWLY